MKEPSARDLEFIESLEFASPAEQLRGWKSIAKKYPDDLIIQMNHAAVLLDTGDIRTARHVCEQAIARCGRRKEIVAQLAMVTHAEGDSDRAFELANEAVALDYRWPPVLALRANVLRERGESAAAAAEYLAAYLAEPHAWDCLQQYCELTGREYRAPDEAPAPTLGPLARAWLYHFVDEAAHAPDAAGNVPGCDHTFRFVQRWCGVAGFDEITTYQFLNAKGGFCDCEVIFNTEAEDEVLDCLALLGGTLDPAPQLRQTLLEGVAVETTATPLIELIAPADEPEEDEDEDEPVLLLAAAEAAPITVLPQLVRGRSWGALAHRVATQAEPAVAFWAAVMPLGDPRSTARPCWAWVYSGGKASEWRIAGKRPPEGIPVALERAIASGVEKLAAEIPSAPQG
ncbi:MAG TPA: DUF2695 domain-containing protein [Polyangiaceae bacterium]|nr:DUF2695 domain-containing protein [Polyangiaceae bacterium]